MPLVQWAVRVKGEQKIVTFQFTIMLYEAIGLWLFPAAFLLIGIVWAGFVWIEKKERNKKKGGR